MESDNNNKSNSDTKNEIGNPIFHETIECQNCEKKFESGFDFCPHCGQKTNENLTVGVLFYNTISNYFSFDARFFKSFIPLLFRPGYLAKKFIEGKRLLYLHPAQMYLFISVVFFFLFSFITREQSQKLDKVLKDTLVTTPSKDSIVNSKTLDSVQVEKMLKPLKDNQVITGMNEDDIKKLDSIIITDSSISNKLLSFDFDEKSIDSLIKVDASDKEIYQAMGMNDDANTFEKRLYTQVLKFYKKREGGSILQTFYDTIPIALFFLLPIFGFLLKLLHYRRGSFAHHLVFSFYFFSFLFTVFSLILCANFIYDIPDGIDWLIILATFFYLFLAIKRFYDQGWIISFFKSGLLTFLFLLFVIPFTAIIVGAIAFMFY